MAIEFAPLTAERLEDLETFLLPVWDRCLDETLAGRILRWRFLERTDGEAILAYDGARAVGFIDSFFRLYRTRSGLVRVREPADWFCHPDYRPVLSLRLIQRLMREPEPIVVVGGNATTVRILPKLGYRELPHLAKYMLPTGTGVMIKGLSRAFRFSLAAVPRYLARPLSMRAMRGSRPSGSVPKVSAYPVRQGTEIPELTPSRSWYGLSPTLSETDHEWYADAPDAMGDFVWRAFETSERGRGLSFSRVYEEGRFRAARLLHIDASAPSLPMYASIIEETVQALMRSRPQWITARFSCPMARAALEKLGFRKYDTSRAFWWHSEMPPPESPIHLSYASADEALLPYPMTPGAASRPPIRPPAPGLPVSSSTRGP